MIVSLHNIIPHAGDDYERPGGPSSLFDEFDALGRGRDDSSEHGEMKQVVTTFLQMLDKYRGPSILVAATNHPGLLDTGFSQRRRTGLT